MVQLDRVTAAPESAEAHVQAVVPSAASVCGSPAAQ
jgi:hypothetical protein